jgi:hypothetical protein
MKEALPFINGLSSKKLGLVMIFQTSNLIFLIFHFPIVTTAAASPFNSTSIRGRWSTSTQTTSTLQVWLLFMGDLEGSKV